MRWCLIVALMLTPAVASAADEPTLDELLGLTGDDAPAPGSDAAPGSDTGTIDDAVPPAADAELEDLLTAEQMNDQFQQAIGEMGDVALRLGRSYDAGLDTQRIQEDIIRKLDQVIASARPSMMMSSGGGSGRPSDAPPRDADTGTEQMAQQDPGAGQPQNGGQQDGATDDPQGMNPNQGRFSPGSVKRITDDRPIEELRSEWGNLPPRLRDELFDALEEKFSPVYRRMTEDYYRRLAEEVNAEDRPWRDAPQR